jgi:hypothetical protein
MPHCLVYSDLRRSKKKTLAAGGFIEKSEELARKWES